MSQDQRYYFDPNHGGCMRILTKVDKDHFIVQGAYGSDEGGKGHWVATMKKTRKFTYEGKNYNLIVDFSKKKIKTHKPVYYAFMDKRNIHWQDGNTWIQMYV